MQEELFLINEPLKFSVSHLEKYIRCPKYYELVYIKNKQIFQIFGDRLLLGTLLHSVVSQYLKLPPERDSRTLESKFIEKFELKFKDSRKEWFNLYLNNLKKFHEQFKLAKVLAVEYRHKMILDDCLITGQVDCIVENSEKDEIILIDFKEGRSEFFETETEYKDIQLVFYSLLAKSKFKDIIESKQLKGGYYYFDTAVINIIDFSQTMVNEGLILIKDLIREIATGSLFPPKKCELCTACGYKDYCSVGKYVSENDFQRSLR